MMSLLLILCAITRAVAVSSLAVGFRDCCRLVITDISNRASTLQGSILALILQ